MYMYIQSHVYLSSKRMESNRCRIYATLFGICIVLIKEKNIGWKLENLQLLLFNLVLHVAMLNS